MGSRAEELAREFETTNDQFAKSVASMSDAQWKAITADEGWPAGVAAHHAAGSTGPLLGFVQAAANGQPLPPITQEQLDALNAQHASEFANASREDVLSLVKEHGPQAAAYIRSLSDEQLDRPANMAFGGTMTTEQIIRNIMIGHLQTHIASAQGAK